jgi:glutamine amidotransferase-like uncharacterized protein
MFRKKGYLFLLIFFFAGVTITNADSEIAIYADYGAWADGVSAFEQFLDWKGVSHERITALQINTETLVGKFQAICFPGGYAFYYKAALTATGLQNIRDLVQSGNGYIGFCAGAYFACDSVDWEEDGLLDYPLNLFDGVASGAIDNIAAWDSYAMTIARMNPRHPVNQFEPEFETMLYYGGPWFRTHLGFSCDTVAAYTAFFDYPAVVTSLYGNGRVLLIGPHPEIEEDDNRDSVAFADELDDQGSDWPFLWSATDWLLGRPITYPTPSFLENQKLAVIAEGLTLSQNYPNPFNASTMIRFSLKTDPTAFMELGVYNLLGQKIAALVSGQQAGGQVQWDAGNLPGGVYFCRLTCGATSITRKMLLVK